MAYRRKSRGVGEYPGYYCYDADRPSWLPYWLDSVTESACKWSPKTIAGNIYACATGDPTCGTPTEAQKNPELSGPGVAPADTPDSKLNTPRCGQFTSFNPQSAECEFNFTSPTFLILAGLGMFAVSVIMGGGSPRRYGR
jgi:hypothetical protein